MGDLKDESVWFVGLIRCYQALGQYHNAIKLHEQNLVTVIVKHLGDRHCLMLAFRGLGECLASLGHYVHAMIKHYKKHWALLQQLGDED